MEPKLVTRRSLSAVPIITVPPQYKEVTKGTERPRPGSRVMFLDENGNEIVDEESKDPYQGHVKGFSKEGRLLPSSATLHLRRRSTSLDAARFTAWYNSRRNSNLRRDQFLQSFGKASIRYPNLNDEDIMETKAHVATRIDVSAFEAETLDGDVLDCRKRSQSAGPILHRPSSSMKSELNAHKNVLEIRGTEYTGDLPDLADLTAKIRQQSAKRRIKRIMEADKEKAEQERLSREEEERRKAEALKTRRRTLKSATFAVMAMNVSAAGFNFKSFTEKKKWLAEKRSWTKQIVSKLETTFFFNRQKAALKLHEANLINTAF